MLFASCDLVWALLFIPTTRLALVYTLYLLSFHLSKHVLYFYHYEIHQFDDGR